MMCHLKAMPTMAAVNPAILPPIVNFRMTTKAIPRMDRRKDPIPAQMDRFKGASEKLIKPSME